MIRVLITSIVLSLLFVSCISEQKKSEKRSNVISLGETTETKGDNIILKISGVKSEIEGVDSLTILSANGKELFKIAEGGNLELLTDTVIRTETNDIGIITLADYFQDNQIFYIIYNPTDSVILQSERLYLSHIGLEISQYKLLDIITQVGDSLFIRSNKNTELNLSLALDTLICNRDGIINYYEFE